MVELKRGVESAEQGSAFGAWKDWPEIDETLERITYDRKVPDRVAPEL